MKTSPSVEVVEPRAGDPPGLTGPCSPPIRVCFLIDRLLPGGTETQLLNLLEHLDRTRVRPYLALLDGEDAISRSLEPVDIPALRLGVRRLRSRHAVKAADRFARFLRREGVDILLTYFADSSYFGVPIARLVGVPRVVRTRFNLGHWQDTGGRWMARLLNRFADAFVVNCGACRRSMIEDEWARPGSIATIPNGIEPDRFQSIPDLEPTRRADRPLRVGMVANLRPVKAPELLVEAAAELRIQYPDAGFLLAGQGDLQSPLERRIAELNLSETVHLVGPVSDVPGFLEGIDVAVLTSRSEGQPNAVLEYMAAGRAIVATAVGGTPDLIEDGTSGLLVPPDDRPALVRALGRLLGDAELASRLGHAARQSVRDRFGCRVRARNYQAFFEGLLTTRRRGRSPSPRP